MRYDCTRQGEVGHGVVLFLNSVTLHSYARQPGVDLLIGSKISLYRSSVPTSLVDVVDRDSLSGTWRFRWATGFRGTVHPRS